MAWRKGVAVGPIQSAIYELTDCLAELTDRLLPFDGPTDDRIDYEECYANYVVASATFVAIADELHLLLDESIVN